MLGLEYAGQLGYGDTNHRGDEANEMGDNLPTVDLGSGKSIKSLVAGWYHTCAVLNDDTVKCWGSNDYGQLGYGDTNYRGDEANEMGDNLPAVSLQQCVAGEFGGSLVCMSCPSGEGSDPPFTSCTACNSACTECTLTNVCSLTDITDGMISLHDTRGGKNTAASVQFTVPSGALVPDQSKVEVTFPTGFFSAALPCQLFPPPPIASTRHQSSTGERSRGK